MYKTNKIKTVKMKNMNKVVIGEPNPDIEIKEHVPAKTMAMLKKSKKSSTSMFHPHY